MKKKFIVIVSILALFALSIAAYAYTRSSGSAAASCCAGDSCPMKGKKAEGSKQASCCDDCACCKDGKAKAESCPMKKHADKKTETAAADHASHNVVVATGESCCGCACCGGEKKKTGEGV
jgi:hypothetical protein